MDRRNFLLGLGSVAGTALICSQGITAPGTATRQPGRCKIVNMTNRTISLKIVGHQPEMHSFPERGALLFPDEFYFDDLGEGKRALIAWDHLGEEILTMQEVKVITPCQIDVYEGHAVVSAQM